MTPPGPAGAVSAAPPPPAAAPPPAMIGVRYIRIVATTASPGLVIRVPHGRDGHDQKNAPGTNCVQHRGSPPNDICLPERIGKTSRRGASTASTALLLLKGCRFPSRRSLMHPVLIML